MGTRSFRPSRRGHAAGDAGKVLDAAVAEAARRRRDYRARSLEIHGWICAKCAREFDAKTLHLLTVHHRDGNHQNNPPDGSNWENLCVDCHDDEHSRGLLADYLAGDDE
jgi:5-methylcytosine-specific restriction endonuclease McrA